MQVAKIIFLLTLKIFYSTKEHEKKMGTTFFSSPEVC